MKKVVCLALLFVVFSSLCPAFAADLEDGVYDVELDTGLIIPTALPEDNEYPSNAPLSGGLYIQANTSQLGQVIIYLPVDYQRYSLGFNTAGNLVNLRTGTITGYMYRGSTLYNFRIASLTTPEYRLANTTNAYAGLTITSILNTNVVFVEGNEDIPLIPNGEMYQLVIIFLLGVIVLCQFIRRFSN